MSKKAFISVALLMLCCTVHSKNNSAPLRVSVVVRASCKIHDVHEVKFPTLDGDFDDIGLAEGSFKVTCSEGAHHSVHLDAGQNFDGLTPRMSDGRGAYIRYRLFADEGLTANWLNPKSGVNASLHHHHKIFGFIPPDHERVQAGHYSDLVTIHVTF